MIRYIKYIGKVYRAFPGYFIIYVNLLFIFVSLGFNYPLLFILIIVLGLNLLFRLEREVLFSPFSVPVIFGFIAFVSHLTARVNFHGRLTAHIFLILLVVLSIIIIYKRKDKLYNLFGTLFESSKSNNILPNIGLTIFIAVFWIYSLKYWPVSGDNSPHAHYIQMAQYMLEHGCFNFLTPEQDVPINGNWWYPNLSAHAIAVFGSFLDRQSLIRFAASLGSFLTLWGIAGVYFLFQKTFKSIIPLTVLILSLFCSYSFFKIGPELSSDTLIFIFLPAFYYFLSSTVLEKRPLYLYLAIATAFFSFWYRFNVAVTMLIAMLIIFVSESFVRKNIILFLKSKTFAKILLIIVIICMGALWPLEVYKITGNPLHPHGYGSIFGENKYSITYDLVSFGKDPFQAVELKEYFPHLVCNLFSDKGGLHILYHFFAITEKALKEHDMFRILRGVFVGFTFSSFLTVFSLMGIILIIKTRKTLIEKISIALVIAVILVIGMGGFHYKFIYILFLPVIVFSIKTFYFFEKKIPVVSTILLVCFLNIFIVSFFMMGMGLERNKWAVLKCLFRDMTTKCYVKDYYHYSIAKGLKSYLKPEDKILNFQPEPGFSLNFHLGMHYYIDEVQYQSINTKGLHQAKSEEEVIQWLRVNNIKVISFTESPIKYYMQNRTQISPEILPAMLINRSNRFYYIGPSIAVFGIDPILLKDNPAVNSWTINAN